VNNVFVSGGPPVEYTLQGIDELETDDDDVPFLWQNVYYPWGNYHQRSRDSDSDRDSHDERYASAEAWYRGPDVMVGVALAQSQDSESEQEAEAEAVPLLLPPPAVYNSEGMHPVSTGAEERNRRRGRACHPQLTEDMREAMKVSEQLRRRSQKEGW